MKADKVPLSWCVLSEETEDIERGTKLAIFARCSFDLLIATDIISRVINPLQDPIIVNFDLPIDQSGEVDYETYFYRIGRTGRFGIFSTYIQPIF